MIMMRIRFLLLACLPTLAAAQVAPMNDYEEPETPAWVESDYALPPFPEDGNLVEFDVDGMANVSAYVDKTAIGAGTPDQIVRYIMVIKTSGGATNVSYEGLRCDTNEYRIYATGTLDKTWSKARNSEWRKFKIHNRPQKSLANYYFCPNFTAVGSAREALSALREGIHPAAARRNYMY